LLPLDSNDPSQKQETPMQRVIFGLAALALLLGGVGRAKADLVITFSQDGANVDATGVGSLNPSALSYLGSFSYSSGVAPELSDVLLGSPDSYDYYGPVSGPSNFGPGRGGYEIASSWSGPPVGLLQNGVLRLVVPAGYVSGTPISASATWDNSTISGLGLTPGTYTYSWGSGVTADSLTVVVPSATATPEPSGLVLAGVGIVTGLGYLGWRRRREQLATA
jgi:hypothetical protein